MNVLLVAGARPNFMKIAPIYRASLKHDRVKCSIVHTGQHYDHAMSQGFFEELGIPMPAHHLEAGSGSHAVQTAKVMVEFEKVCQEVQPDLILVVGDVNSTLACSIVAKKLMIEVGHVEAGLRSFDLSMPEEINRMVTDAISDWFFVTEESGATNLLAEGKSQDKIHVVGHVMVDNLLHQLEILKMSNPSQIIARMLNEATSPYLFMTLHRPSNVDERATFCSIVEAVNILARNRTIFFPVHPRTKQMMERHGISLSEHVQLLPPLGFRESLALWSGAEAVLTDSGGLQEETTALGVPCITIRENTERPVTVSLGSNVLAGTSVEGILAAFDESLGKKERVTVPPMWDGRASERIWSKLLQQGID
jgi:UDP-N-acetylglucosamine 2-epimerase (non-hydrolysing)